MTSARSEWLSEQLLTWINAELREEIARRDLLATEAVEAPSFWKRQAQTLVPLLLCTWGCWFVTHLA